MDVNEGVVPALGLSDLAAPSIVLVDVADHDGSSFRDGAQPADLAELALDSPEPDCALRISFEVVGGPLSVTLKITYEPDGSLRDDFYESYAHRGELTGTLVYSRSLGVLESGEHRVCWSGRDSTLDRRLLLEGRYRVMIGGERSGNVVEGSTVLDVGPPNFFAVGVNYYVIEDDGTRTKHNSATELSNLTSRVSGLEPGRRFDAGATGAIRANVAVERWRRCGVALFDAHGYPSKLMFHAVEGVEFEEQDRSVLRLFPVREGDGEGSVDLCALGREVFADVLLAVVLGCNTGQDIVVEQMLLREAYDYLHAVRARGGMSDALRDALWVFQRARELPMTLDLDPLTLVALEVPTTAPRREQIAAARTRLRAHADAIGELKTGSGQYDAPTIRAFEGFQAMAGIPVTGESDELTRDRLGVGEPDPRGRNIAQQFMRAGCDVVVGFPRVSHFGTAEAWLHVLFRELQRGVRLPTALQAATDSVREDRRREFEYHIYERPGIDPQTFKLVPARYGSLR